MSTRDARLSPQERAALASLEAAAVADDPQFAARLRGSPLFRLQAAAPRLWAWLVGQWRALLRNPWWGVPLTVTGFILMVLGLPVSGWVSGTGAVMAAVGMGLGAETLDRSWERRRAETRDRE
jgi:hypothetical protein